MLISNRRAKIETAVEIVVTSQENLSKGLLEKGAPFG
jgi:hypothetical protein